jgi:histidinol dehydrogenase
MRAERFELDSSAVELAARLRALVPQPADVRDVVAEVIEDVRARGDAAVLEWTRKFEGEAVTPAFARPEEVRNAPERVDSAVREGLEVAIANVRDVAQAELRSAIEVDLPQGQHVELRELPVRRAGIYAPAGRAAYPSTVVMCSVPARVAGVEELIVVTPAGGKEGRDVILAACALSGVEDVYFAGGAQAIAALAHGTETVPPVDMIVGPGNAYVQEAKRQVFGTVGIDGVAGPSELLVVADAGAEPRLVALDLAAQAEHGAETLLVLATPSEELLEAVAAEAAGLSERPSVSDAPLALVHVPDLETAVELSNAIAPEHLELAVAETDRLTPLVRAAGCVFLGRTAGAAFGDYAAGSNHVLPTGGAARFDGPLGASTFLRRQALVSLPGGAAQRLAPHVGSIARAEGFPVHGDSAEARA